MEKGVFIGLKYAIILAGGGKEKTHGKNISGG